jgi:hypothetical protein
MSVSIAPDNLLIISVIGLVPSLIVYLNLAKVHKFLQSEMDKDSKTTGEWDAKNPLMVENEYGEISFNVMNPPKEGEEIRILRIRFEQIKIYRGIVNDAKNLTLILFVICAAGVGWAIGTW